MQAFVPRDIFGTTGSLSKKLLVNNGLNDIRLIHAINKENMIGTHQFINQHIQGPTNPLLHRGLHLWPSLAMNSIETKLGVPNAV
jgi:hypothetical protein